MFKTMMPTVLRAPDDGTGTGTTTTEAAAVGDTSSLTGGVAAAANTSGVSGNVAGNAKTGADVAAMSFDDLRDYVAAQDKRIAELEARPITASSTGFGAEDAELSSHEGRMARLEAVLGGQFPREFAEFDSASANAKAAATHV